MLVEAQDTIEKIMLHTDKHEINHGINVTKKMINVGEEKLKGVKLIFLAILARQIKQISANKDWV